MTREEARKEAEIMLAYAEGNNIQFAPQGTESWQPCKNPMFNFIDYAYRVQPDPKYRPFKNAEECFEEMRKHEPFGWLINKKTGCYVYPVSYTSIAAVFADENVINFNNMFKKYTFADGVPFGIKED